MTEKTVFNFKIFDKYDILEIEIKDPALKRVINLTPKLILKSHGRNVGKFEKSKVNIIERLANKIAVAGHRGKKHKIQLGRVTGKYNKNIKIVLDAFEILEKQTGQNPVQVFIKALENAAPNDEITVIEYGGARYPQAVDVSPTRRVNVALK
ncbi:MAG: 30S ribosomal protein S7, partial [Nanoarchaeota archaeon]